MIVQFTVYTIPLLVTAVLTAASTVLLWRRALDADLDPDTVSANHAQLLVLVLLTFWMIGSLITVSARTPEVKLFGLYLSVVSGVWVAASWFCFVLLYTGRNDWVTPSSVALISAGAVIGTIGIATNGLHELIIKNPQVVTQSTRTVLTFEWNIGMWLGGVYDFVLTVTALRFLAEKFATSRNVYRKITLLHIVGGVVLGGSPLLSMAGPSPFPYLLLSSLGFFGIAVVSVAATVSYRYLSLIPLEPVLAGISKLFSTVGSPVRNLEPMARDVIIQNMESGVIVVDHNNRIVDINPKARRMTAAEDEHIVGRALTDVIDPTSFRTENVDFMTPGTTGTFRGIWIEIANAEDRCYDIVLNSIDGRDDRSSGRVALITDVTDRERRKEKLEQRTQEFDLLRQVQSRVLRHNIRNDLTMIRGGVEQLTDNVEDNPHAVGILEATDDLMSISEKVQLVEDVIDADAQTSECDLRSLVEGMADTIERQYPNVEIEIEGPDSYHVTAITRLEVAIENILENAVEHNDSPTPRVSVRITDDPRPALTISDNGPGIPDQETAVLEHERETPLEHGSSIGLWLIKWIVDRSDADLTFETGPSGTEVTIQFAESQRVTASPRSAVSTHR